MPRGSLHQFRVLFYLDPPAVVVGKMPVEPVHLVGGNEIDVTLDKLFWEKMARYVQMHAAVWIPGSIFNFNTLNFPGSAGNPGAGLADFGRHELKEGLDAIEKSRPAFRRNADLLRCHF